MLWLFSDPHGTAVSQKKVLRESIKKIYFIFFLEYWDSFIASFIFKNK